MNNMKINLIIPSFHPAVVYGGPIFSALHISEELAKLGDVGLYVSTTNANMDSYLDVETDNWIKQQEHFFVKYYNDIQLYSFIQLLLVIIVFSCLVRNHVYQELLFFMALSNVISNSKFLYRSIKT